MDLVIHAGLSKTATTTIQNSLMKGASHYLGRDDRGDGRFVAELMELARRWPFMPASDVSSRTQAWVASVAATGRAPGAAGTVTLSCEQLLNWRINDTDFLKTGLAVSPRNLPWLPRGRKGKWPLTTFLMDYLVPAWSVHGDVRIAVGLRRQSDWLASQYAQISSRIYAPSQADFESQVTELIARQDPYIFWDGLVAELSSVVGFKNLHVFLFEDLGTPDTWMDLACFLGLSKNDRRISTAQSIKVNQRSATDRSWKLRASRRDLISQSVDITWPEHYLPFVRGGVFSAARLLDRVAGRRLIGLIHPHADEAIQLNEELTSMIRTYCADSNGRLAGLIGRDLKSLGY